ncbi:MULTISPECIES: hypothetical protein [Actinosynnema]|uniref:hypothetical protein n=1 Tax=Actinosynnema TaxID=40566 RepID=UPI0020A259B0|nr:hypothetical protein [Actinosynnema pretiosum]MCP2098679.1 hypothetical protein [Actinosynnema pretiosum]
MNTDLVTPTATAVIPQQLAANPADELELAVEKVLASVRPSSLGDPAEGSRRAERVLRDALDLPDESTNDALRQARACVEAACEHLRYQEFQEARLLLVASRGQLVRAHTGRA